MMLDDEEWANSSRERLTWYLHSEIHSYPEHTMYLHSEIHSYPEHTMCKR